MLDMVYEGEYVRINKAAYNRTSNLYLGLIVASGENEGEMLCDITKDITVLPLNHGAVDVIANEDIDLFVRAYKLGEPTGKKIKSGLYEYPIYKFNMDVIEKYTEK